MDKINSKKIKDLMHSIGLKHGLSDNQVKEIVNSPYEFTNLIIKNLNLNEVQTKDELDSLKTNFIYKSFAKLYVNFLLINRRNKKKNKQINLNKVWKK
jgi:hypothetical protein